jgi:hypothetical protein
MSLRKPPLWARWVLTFLVFVLLTVAIVVAIHHVNHSEPSPSEGSSALEADRESRLALEQDQAPHTSTLGTGAPAHVALQRAIGADMLGLIRHEELSGPLQGVRCSPAGSPRAGRQAFSCTARAAAIPYPFLGVVDERGRRLTWCKFDPPPVSGGPQEVPVSKQCRV